MTPTRSTDYAQAVSKVDTLDLFDLARAANAAGLHHTVALISVLADLDALPPDPPPPTVELAHRLDRHPGTIRRQLRALADAGFYATGGTT